MPFPKVNFLDKKLPTSFSISRRTRTAFTESCEALGLTPSNIVESLLKEFIKDVNQKPKK